jgi:hypothetical protein
MLARIAAWTVGLGLLTLFATGNAIAEPLKPFVLGKPPAPDFATAVEQTRNALQDAGFTIAGEYKPYAGAHVIAVTSDTLKSEAAKTDHGGFAAAQRVSITDTAAGIQVAYTNPPYVAAAFRLASDLAPVARSLEAALGATQTFGSESGLEPDKLRKYRYMFAMPYFDDVDELGSFPSYGEAVTTIEQRLKAGAAGTRFVYRIDIPGKGETVFGVGIGSGEGADEAVMGVTDTGDLKHTAHLPYQILVTGNKAIALPGKFRIAVSFPDLGMGTFMRISNAPGAIQQTLTEVVQGP